MNTIIEATPEVAIQLQKGRYGLFFETPPQLSFHSVSLILRCTMDAKVRQKIENSSQRKVINLGRTRAEEISNADICRGKIVHKALKDYFEKQTISEEDITPTNQGFIQALNPIVSAIKQEDCYAVEEYACHPPLGYACRLDFRGLWGGEHTIMELKTSTKGMPQEWLEDKILQAIAARMAHNYIFPHNPVSQVMVVNAFYTPSIPPGTNCYIIKGQELEIYEEKWLERLRKFEPYRSEIYPTAAHNF